MSGQFDIDHKIFSSMTSSWSCSEIRRHASLHRIVRARGLKTAEYRGSINHNHHTYNTILRDRVPDRLRRFCVGCFPILRGLNVRRPTMKPLLYVWTWWTNLISSSVSSVTIPSTPMDMAHLYTHDLISLPIKLWTGMWQTSLWQRRSESKRKPPAPWIVLFSQIRGQRVRQYTETTSWSLHLGCRGIGLPHVANIQ